MWTISIDFLYVNLKRKSRRTLHWSIWNKGSSLMKQLLRILTKINRTQKTMTMILKGTGKSKKLLKRKDWPKVPTRSTTNLNLKLISKSRLKKSTPQCCKGCRKRQFWNESQTQTRNVVIFTLLTSLIATHNWHSMGRDRFNLHLEGSVAFCYLFYSALWLLIF